MKVVRVQRSIARNGYDIWFVQYLNRVAHVVKPITIQTDEKDHGAWVLPEPSLFIPFEEMLPWSKAFIEGLETEGLMDKIKEDQGVLKATREHLEDMRKMSERMLAKLVTP